MTRIIKSIFIFLINFLVFVFPYLFFFLHRIERFEFCLFYSIDFCDLIYKSLESNILIYLLLGISTSVFSFLANYSSERLSKIFSVFYSLSILIFCILIFNFGEMRFSLTNLSIIDRIDLRINFKTIFYFLVISALLDLIRKIINLIFI